MTPHMLFQLRKYDERWVLSELKIRSLFKTISWRITGSGATFLIAYILIGDLNIAGAIGIIQFISNTILYYVHERMWNKIT
jgi:uncharacterized membrane protein